LRSYDSAPRPPVSPLSRQQLVSLSQSSCVSPAELTDVRGGRRRWARSQIIRPRESLSPELELLLILTGSQTPFSGVCTQKRGGRGGGGVWRLLDEQNRGSAEFVHK
jgi:hypothetical protein